MVAIRFHRPFFFQNAAAFLLCLPLFCLYSFPHLLTIEASLLNNASEKKRAPTCHNRPTFRLSPDVYCRDMSQTTVECRYHPQRWQQQLKVCAKDQRSALVQLTKRAKVTAKPAKIFLNVLTRSKLVQ